MTTRADAHDDEFHKDATWKFPVRVATTVAGTLASSFENGDTVDGVVLATGDRILIKDQAAGSANGIYVVAASGAPARAYDMDSGLETVGSLVYVVGGTVNGGQFWNCTNTGTVTIGTTALTFAQISSSSGGGVTGFATPAIVLGSAAAAGAATTVIRSDSTVAAFDATVPTTQAFGDAAATGSAAFAARRDHLHGMPATPASDHEHINDVQFSGDGATTAFELPAAPFDAYAVMAYVAGVRQDVVLSGTLLTTMTFSSAPAAGTNNIIVDIVAIAA